MITRYNLDQSLREVLLKILRAKPDIVIGGSFGLVANNLLDREIGDLDLFIGLNDGFLKTVIFGAAIQPTDTATEHFSDTITDMAGNPIQRSGYKLNGVKICVFKVPDFELQYDEFIAITDHKQRLTVRIQKPIIMYNAKLLYLDKSPKHAEDIAYMNSLNLELKYTLEEEEQRVKLFSL